MKHACIRNVAPQVTILNILDKLLRSYDKPTWEQKCHLVYQHVFDSYKGAGDSIYAKAG